MDKKSELEVEQRKLLQSCELEESKKEVLQREIDKLNIQFQSNIKQLVRHRKTLIRHKAEFVNMSPQERFFMSKQKGLKK